MAMNFWKNATWDRDLFNPPDDSLGSDWAGQGGRWEIYGERMASRQT